MQIDGLMDRRAIVEVAQAYHLQGLKWEKMGCRVHEDGPNEGYSSLILIVVEVKKD